MSERFQGARRSDYLPISRKAILATVAGTAMPFVINGCSSTPPEARLHSTGIKKPTSSPNTLRQTPYLIMETPQSPPETGFDLLSEDWSHMPGVTQNDGGLLVSPINFQIVEQDGSFSTENPPINFTGTHVENISGDFTINASINPQDSEEASLNLYGKLPVVADEFLIERESLKLSYSDGKFSFNLRSIDQGQIADEFPVQTGENLKVQVSRVGSSIVIMANDQELAVLQETNTFGGGQIWFGLDSSNGNWILSDLTINGINGGNLEVVNNSEVTVSSHDPEGLQNLARNIRPEFLIGTTSAIGPAVSDPEYFRIVYDNHIFGSHTPENQMKMINIQPEKGVYTFEYADALVDMALRNGISIHGHALVFGEANPIWFNQLPAKSAKDKKEIRRVMLDHIQTVVTHFKGRVNSWDVINEPMADYDDTRDGEGAELRKHKWFQAMGRDYIVEALEEAHKANPEAMLFINEYGLEADGKRWKAFLDLMKRLKPELEARNIPIEKIGVGFQSHVYDAEWDEIDPQVLRKHLRQLGELGYKARVSEIDVTSGEGDTFQGQQYASVLDACISEPNCVGLTAWIPSDRYNFWKDGDEINQGQDGLFGTYMEPRPGLTQMQNLLKLSRSY